MKTCLDCIPCFFAQALRAGRIATDDEALVKRILDELGSELSSLSLDSTPPEIGRTLYGRVREITGTEDPYRRLKHESTEQALALYPALKRRIEEAEDGLLTAIRLAIAGNIIDFGINETFDINATVEEALRQEFAICDYDAFRNRLEACSHVLYIGDNAGETVFDRLLIEQCQRPVTYVVRDRPVINDATAADAVAAGLDSVATIVSSGTDAPGTILSTCSPEFRRMLTKSEFTIAKGQGNYEGLSGEDVSVFFLLKAKCRIIARDIGVQLGDIILKGMNI